jgi:hypothetical protein
MPGHEDGHLPVLGAVSLTGPVTNPDPPPDVDGSVLSLAAAAGQGTCDVQAATQVTLSGRGSASVRPPWRPLVKGSDLRHLVGGAGSVCDAANRLPHQRVRA